MNRLSKIWESEQETNLRPLLPNIDLAETLKIIWQ